MQVFRFQSWCGRMILIECDALKNLHHQLGPKSIDCQEAARGSVSTRHFLQRSYSDLRDMWDKEWIKNDKDTLQELQGDLVLRPCEDLESLCIEISQEFWSTEIQILISPMLFIIASSCFHHVFIMYSWCVHDVALLFASVPSQTSKVRRRSGTWPFQFLPVRARGRNFETSNIRDIGDIGSVPKQNCNVLQSFVNSLVKTSSP